MRKRSSKKLQIATETLRRLDPPIVRKVVGGQDYQCPPTVDESGGGGFSGGTSPGYCYTISGHSECA